MIIYSLTHTTSGYEFLQGTIPVILSLFLILMIIDAIIDAKSERKFRSHLNSKTKRVLG